MASPQPVPGVFPLFRSERPSVAAAKEWFRDARPCLLPDWSALVAGVTPCPLLAYAPRTVPATLVVGADLAVAGAISPAQVATRDALIQQVIDDNYVRAHSNSRLIRPRFQTSSFRRWWLLSRRMRRFLSPHSVLLTCWHTTPPTKGCGCRDPRTNAERPITERYR